MKTERICAILSLVSITFSTLAILTIRHSARSVKPVEVEQVEEYSTGGFWLAYLEYVKLHRVLRSVKVSYQITNNTLEEEPSEEMNCLSTQRFR